jgi:acyl carrier protein
MEFPEKSVAEVCQLVADTLEVPRTTISLETGPQTLPAWDSFHHVYVMVSVEERFNIQLSVDEIAAVKTVRDILQVLQDKGSLTS